MDNTHSTDNQQELAPLVGEFSEINYEFQCAADLAHCLHLAASSADTSLESGENFLSNALFGLHQYMQSLCDKQKQCIEGSYAKA